MILSENLVVFSFTCAILTTCYVINYFLLAIGNAFAVLNDKDKRKKYDMYCPEEEQSRGHSHREYDYTHGFEGQKTFCVACPYSKHIRITLCIQ